MSRLASASFRALGTTALVAVADPAALPEARALLERELDAVDRACSRFREDSELTRLPAAGGRETEVSELLADALHVALRAARLTAGLVTPTIGRSLVLAGYDRDHALLEPCAERPAFAPALDWRLIDIDRSRRTVRVPAGVELDLGATAKALASDRAATAISKRAGCGTLVSLGGDIRVAGDPPPVGWPIAVDDAHDVQTAAACRIRLTNGALATSSTVRRRWRTGASELHHILDPETGAPAGGPWKTVSVAAATCVDANVASTAAIILGEGAADWLADRRLPARLVADDGTAVTVAGWPEDAP